MQKVNVRVIVEYTVCSEGVQIIALSMVLFYRLVMGCSLSGCSMYLVIIGTSKGEQWSFLNVILLQIFQSLEVGYVMMNQYLVGNAVLYTYCKDLNDQKLSGDNEFGSEYVSLNMVWYFLQRTFETMTLCLHNRIINYIKGIQQFRYIVPKSICFTLFV